MKKINKKIMYGMGAIIMVASPITAVLSCGNKSEYLNLKIQGKSYKINSITELIQTMNKSMHFIANKPSDVIGKALSPDEQKANNNYPISKEQYQEIGNGVITDQTFNLSFNGKSQTVTSNFHNDTQTVKDQVDNMVKPTNWNSANGIIAKNAMLKRTLTQIVGGPNMVAYVANITMTIGMNSTGYLSLPQVAWDAYLHELNLWSDFTWSIASSNVFKDWIKNKNIAYLAPKVAVYANANGQIDKKDLINPLLSKNDPNQMDKVGINIDDQATALKLLGVSKPMTPTKISNLELQFGYMIQNLYSPDALK